MISHAFNHPARTVLHADEAPRLRVGVDVVQISAVAESLAAFGERYTRRLFSIDEVAYAMSAPALAPQRLAARFAAKEAAIKAFGWSEAGIDWRDIEVRRTADGSCSLALHGQAAALVERSACTQIALSLSHDGDCAAAMVAALAPN
jgi:holo-[acyl-carrier protein] synthase